MKRFHSIGLAALLVAILVLFGLLVAPAVATHQPADKIHVSARLLI